MRPISAEIVNKLNSTGLGEPIHYVGLGAHDFQFAFGDFNVRSENKVIFTIAAARYEWTEGPIEAPVWTLVGLKVVGVESTSGETLKFTLSSGNEIEAWTDDSQYEAVIVEAKVHGILEVF
ncbi:MAG: hypothetical protein ABI853_04620 [Sphingomicrobium sp.]